MVNVFVKEDVPLAAAHRSEAGMYFLIEALLTEISKAGKVEKQLIFLSCKITLTFDFHGGCRLAILSVRAWADQLRFEHLLQDPPNKSIRFFFLRAKAQVECCIQMSQHLSSSHRTPARRAVFCQLFYAVPELLQS